MSDELPPITVMLLTYASSPAREGYALRTLSTLMGRVRYSGPLYLHIADDGSPAGHIERLAACAERELQFHDGRTGRVFRAVTASNSERRGYGANFNAATMVVHDRGGLVLPLEDDWEMLREIDLDPLARALAAPSPIGSVRMGYLGFWDEIRGKFIHAADQTFILLDRESPSQDVFAGHPRLESVEWERFVGLWPEGLSAGDTEIAVSGRREARTGVAWPCDLVLTRGDLFGHIGSLKATNPGEEL